MSSSRHQDISVPMDGLIPHLRLTRSLTKFLTNCPRWLEVPHAQPVVNASHELGMCSQFYTSWESSLKMASPPNSLWNFKVPFCGPQSLTSTAEHISNQSLQLCPLSMHCSTGSMTQCHCIVLIVIERSNTALTASELSESQLCDDDIHGIDMERFHMKLPYSHNPNDAS